MQTGETAKHTVGGAASAQDRIAAGVLNCVHDQTRRSCAFYKDKLIFQIGLNLRDACVYGIWCKNDASEV